MTSILCTHQAFREERAAGMAFCARTIRSAGIRESHTSRLSWRYRVVSQGMTVKVDSFQANAQQAALSVARMEHLMQESNGQSNSQLSYLLELPAELYAYFALGISVRTDLESTYNLVRTCRSLYNSATGQSVRYLWALQKHNCPTPASLPRPLDSLISEADRLLRCSWPPEEYFGPERVWRLTGSGLGNPTSSTGLAGIDLTTLIIDGTHMAGLTADRRGFAHFVTEASLDQQPDQYRTVASHETMGHIHVFDVDFDEGVAALATIKEVTVPSGSLNGGAHPETMPTKQVFVQVIDIQAGTLKTALPLDVAGDCDDDGLQVEILGPNILLRAGAHITVHRWQRSEATKSSPSDSWQLLWKRSEAASVFPALTAHLLGLDIVVVMSTPTSSEHGLDWGSTMEFYRFTQSHASRVADIQLPIRAKPVRGQSYIKTGLGKRLRTPRDNGLLVVCVEGFIWVADLEPFMDLLFPQNALSLFGAGHPILDSHWVRAHMHKCSLATLDACPLRPVAVNGWRIAALWSRNYYYSASTELPSRTKHSAYIRFLQADPRYRQEPSRVTSRDQRPDQADHPPLHTMFVPHRFYSYCDHDLYRYIGNLSAWDTFVHLDGARLLLTSPSHASVVFT